MTHPHPHTHTHTYIDHGNSLGKTGGPHLYSANQCHVAGPRVHIPRSSRWAATGAITVSASTALLVRLFSPECEPQNIEAYDKKK